MKWPWALTLLVLVLASGCTGTVEDPIETLLIVGFTNQGRGQLALIQNNILQDGTLTWLTESVRELPGLPRAADVVDRAFEREALLVLSRNDTGVSYLSTFNLRNLAPDRLDGFSETARIALNDLPGPRPTVICPTRLQVSSDGRFAAVLNQPTACGAAGGISIIVLRLDRDPHFVSHYEGLFPIVANALVLDQAGDTLYFLEAVGARVQLKSLDLNRLAERPDKIGEAAIDGSDVQDMGIVLDSMVVLGSGSFVAFENYRVHGDAAPPVDTRPRSLRLISSDFVDTPEVMILGRNDFTVHLNVTDVANHAPLLDYRSGTVEALNRLVFLVGEGEVRVFDLATYAGREPDIRTRILLPITAPAFISWVAALVPPP